jgi:anti-sigma factor RsiW
VTGHESGLLGAYVLGVLDHDEHAGVQAHLDSCPRCRTEVGDLRGMEAALGEIPPEAFLDGPPPGGDPLLRDILAEVRGEHRRRARRRWIGGAVAVVLAGVLAVAGGAYAGWAGSRDAEAAAPAAVVSFPVGTRTGAAADAGTGATMSVAVQPAAGWVRVRATVGGVAPGEQCRLFVLGPDGVRQPAASWLTSESGTATVDGSALMAPVDVIAVQAETYAGRILVSVPV